MPDMRYFQSKDKFLDYAYDIFKPYFPDEDEFIRQFESLPSDEAKNHFLHIASFYKLLVRDGKFICTDPDLPEYTDYIDETFRYVALISLIEALYETEEYMEFFEWLMIKAKQGTLNISTPQSLQGLHETYNQVYGLTQKATRFFTSLPADAQRPILTGLIVGQEPKPIEYLSKLLYRMRSEFVHSAKLILEIGIGTIITRRNEKLVVSTLTFEELQRIFEVGVLTYFRFVT